MRPTDVPDTGLLCDLLWSDPDKDITGTYRSGPSRSAVRAHRSSRPLCRVLRHPRVCSARIFSLLMPLALSDFGFCAGWGDNDRGVSFTFGPDVVGRFLQRHDLDLICRAHQVVEDGTLPLAATCLASATHVAGCHAAGYEFFAKRQLVTLFSAPNYCGEFDNAGAMMSVDDTLMFVVAQPLANAPGCTAELPLTCPAKQVLIPDPEACREARQVWVCWGTKHTPRCILTPCLAPSLRRMSPPCPNVVACYRAPIVLSQALRLEGAQRLRAHLRPKSEEHIGCPSLTYT